MTRIIYGRAYLINYACAASITNTKYRFILFSNIQINGKYYKYSYTYQLYIVITN